MTQEATPANGRGACNVPAASPRRVTAGELAGAREWVAFRLTFHNVARLFDGAAGTPRHQRPSDARPGATQVPRPPLLGHECNVEVAE